MSSRAVGTILNNSRPFFALERKNIPEIIIDGVWTYKKGDEPTMGHQVQVVMRSLFKPWQFMGLDLFGDPFSSGDKKIPQNWALALSSHSAQEQHVQVLERLLKEVETDESHLVCPRSYPMDIYGAALAKERGVSPSRLNHPCAGKHLAFIAACKKYGLSTDHYWSDQHPIHKKITSFIGTQINEKPVWSIDSCGLPTIGLSTFEVVNLWQKLASSPEPRYAKSRVLIVENPFLMGGTTRLDSELIEKGQGKIIAKEGADGLLVISSIAQENEPAATCFVKLASGYNKTYLALALWSILSQLDGLTSGFRSTREFLRTRLENWIPSDQDLKILLKLKDS